MTWKKYKCLLFSKGSFQITDLFWYTQVCAYWWMVNRFVYFKISFHYIYIFLPKSWNLCQRKSQLQRLKTTNLSWLGCPISWLFLLCLCIFKLGSSKCLPIHISLYLRYLLREHSLESIWCQCRFFYCMVLCFCGLVAGISVIFHSGQNILWVNQPLTATFP